MAKTPAPTRVEEIKTMRRLGDAGGVTVSRAALAATGFKRGQKIRVTASPGAITVSQEHAKLETTSEAERTLAAGQACLEQFRWALEKLGEEAFSE